MRQVVVHTEWKGVHTVEVEDDHPKIEADDLTTLIEASGDDISANSVEITDWDIKDPGPKES